MIDLTIHPLAVFTAAALISAIATWLLIHWPGKNPFIKDRQEVRWRMERIPNSGGLAIGLVFFTGMLINGTWTPGYLGLLLGASAIFLVGLFDDLINIRAHIKFALQIGIACLAVAFGIQVKIIDYPLLSIPLTILWIVGITNAFNLLDNMDGLSAGIALIAAVFVYLFSSMLGATASAYPAILLAGATLGFLVFNFHPAKIFMGDSGSLLLGFSLACITIIGTWHQASNLLFMLLMPLLLLAVPIFDTTLVTIQRKLHARPVSSGGRDHSSHRLVLWGFSEPRAVQILYGIAIFCGLLALMGIRYDIYLVSLIAALFIICMLIFGFYLSDRKVYERKPATTAEQPAAWGSDARFNIKQINKRRMAEILIDLFIFCVAYFAAYMLRFEAHIDDYNMALFAKSLPLLLMAKFCSFLLIGVYRGVWRYVTFTDVYRLFSACLLGSSVTLALLVGLYRFSSFSRAVLVIDLLLTFMLVSGSRVSLRALRESLYAYSKEGRKVLIVGAGEAAAFVLNEIRKHRELGLTPVGLLDDDPQKFGRNLLGVPVIGRVEELAEWASRTGAIEIIVAIPSAHYEVKQRITHHCRKSGLKTTFMQNFLSLFSEGPSPNTESPLEH